MPTDPQPRDIQREGATSRCPGCGLALRMPVGAWTVCSTAGYVEVITEEAHTVPTDPKLIPQHVVEAACLEARDIDDADEADRTFIAAALDALFTDAPVYVQDAHPQDAGAGNGPVPVRPSDVLAAVLEPKT